MSLKGYIVLLQHFVKVGKSAAQSLFWTFCRLGTPTSGLEGLCFKRKSWGVGGLLENWAPTLHPLILLVLVRIAVTFLWDDCWNSVCSCWQWGAGGHNACAKPFSWKLFSYLNSVWRRKWFPLKITSFWWLALPTVFFWCLTLWKEAERLAANSEDTALPQKTWQNVCGFSFILSRIKTQLLSLPESKHGKLRNHKYWK